MRSGHLKPLESIGCTLLAPRLIQKSGFSLDGQMIAQLSVAVCATCSERGGGCMSATLRSVRHELTHTAAFIACEDGQRGCRADDVFGRNPRRRTIRLCSVESSMTQVSIDDACTTQEAQKPSHGSRERHSARLRAMVFRKDTATAQNWILN